MKQKQWFFMLIVFLLLSTIGTAQNTLQEEQDFRFAVQLESKGLFDIAALQFERYAELYPTSTQAPEALLRAGQNYEKADSLGRASHAFMAALLRYPQSPVVDRVQFSQAQLLAKNNEHLKAAIAFDRVKILAPESALIPEAQIAAAQSFLSAGEHQKAYDAALYILENYPTHPTRLQAYRAIADVHENKGDYTAAIHFLDRILGDRVEDDAAASVYTKKSQLLKKLGRYTQSDSVLFKLVTGKYGSPIVAGAAVELAKNMQAQRRFDEAEILLQDALDKVDIKDKAALWQTLGDNFYAQGDYAQARQTYMRLADSPAKSNGLYAYRLGMVNKQLKDLTAALSYFAQLQQDEALDPDIRFYGAIEYANVLALAGRAVDAVRFLQETVAGTASLAKRNELFLAMAKIQENYLNDYAGARQNYNAIIAGSPKSAILDDAQYFVARSYEHENNDKSALNEYNRYLQYYPGGDYFATSQHKVNFLKRIVPQDAANQKNILNEILAQGMSTNSPETLISLAEYQIFAFYDYERALALLQRAESMDSNERLNREKIEYDKALCFFVLHEKAVNGKNPGAAQQHSEQLQQIAKRMQMNFPASRLTAFVDFWAVQSSMPNLTAGQERIDELNSAIGRMADDSLRQHLQLQLVDEMVANSSERQSLQQASSILADIINQNGAGLNNPEALYKQALLLHKLSLADSATTLLNRSLVLPNNPRRVDALFLLATIYEERQNFIDAQRLYVDVVDGYFYSPWAERAEARLIGLMVKQGQASEAQKRMQAREKTGVPYELKIFYPQQVDDETLWLWAQVTRGTQSPQKAIEVLHKYLDLGKDATYRAEALFAIGELADDMHKKDMALGYFQECATSFPNDSLGQQALIKTADLYFERGMYEQARAHYETMRENLSGDLQRQAFQYLIICDFRLGKLSRAESGIKEFKKIYDDRNAEARFLYEEGMHYIDVKDLSKAEKTLKSLAGKYDDVPEGARGDLGLARLYVVQTKTEEALERLTEIPQKYKDPDIVATAYLNLADFYYENRALENTISAAKNVLDLQEKGPMRAQALDLLINAYDDLGLRDQAIAFQREYIEAYPYASNILDRRIRIGTFLYYLKEYDRAITELKDVQPLVPADDEARVQFWIAESYAAGGFTEQAIIEYLKVRYQCKQHPKLPFGVTAVYKAGEGFQKLGNYAKAKEMYEIVVRERGATDDFGRAANRKLQELLSLEQKNL